MSVLEATNTLLRRFPPFKLIPRNKLKIFASDIVLVALGIRSGYLFDTFPIYNASVVLSQLLEELRKVIPKYQDQIILRDPSFDQYFFVNAPLLLSRIRNEFTSEANVNTETERNLGSHDPTRWTSFVLSEAIPRKLQGGVPPSVHDIIRAVYVSLSEKETGTAMISLPTTEAKDIIPLAAIILEYPVAYVPTSSQQTSFLSGVELDVYECSLALGEKDTTTPHVFLKFSSPHDLSTNIAFDFQNALTSRFSERCRNAGIGGTVTVRKYQQKFDRVAL